MCTVYRHKVSHFVRYTVVMLSFLLFVPHLRAQKRLRLVEAVNRAVNNPLYQARVQLIEVLRGRVLQAGKRPNPNLETEIETAKPLEGSGEHLISIVLSQKWERGGKRSIRQQVAQAQLEQAVLGAEDYMRTLKSEVQLAYLALLSLERRLSLSETHLDRVDKLIRFDELRVREGEIPFLNPLHLVSERTRLAVHRNEMDSEYTLAQYRLNTLIGADPTTEYLLIDEELPEMPVPAAEQLVNFALKNRPDLKKARLTVEEAQFQIQMEEAAAKSDWDLGVGYHRIQSELGEGEFRPRGLIQSVTSTANLLEFNVTIPIPVWDNNSGNLAAAIEDRKLKELEFTSAEAMVRREVLTAHEQYQLSQRVSETYREELVPMIEERLRRIEGGYQLTGEDVSEWLESFQELAEATFQNVEADFQLKKAFLILEKELGGSLQQASQMIP